MLVLSGVRPSPEPRAHGSVIRLLGLDASRGEVMLRPNPVCPLQPNGFAQAGGGGGAAESTRLRADGRGADENGRYLAFVFVTGDFIAVVCCLTTHAFCGDGRGDGERICPRADWILGFSGSNALESVFDLRVRTLVLSFVAFGQRYSRVGVKVLVRADLLRDPWERALSSVDYPGAPVSQTCFIA